MRKLTLILPALLLILTAVPIVSAHEQEKEMDRLRFAIKTENRFRIHSESDDDEDENEFQIIGQVEATTGSSFSVGGHTILIDLTKVDEFKQVGMIDVGDNVIAKGVIIDGANYAEKIVVVGEGASILKFKIKGISFNPSPSASPSPSVSPSPSPEATPSLSPSPTATPEIVVDVRARGPIEVVKEFLAQVLAYLEGLIS